MPSAEAVQLVGLMRNATVVDLSVTTGVELPCSPPEGQPPAQFLLNSYTWPRGPFLEYVQVHDDHTGTHVDSPSHFTPGGATIEQVSLEQLMGPAAVVDVRSLIDAAAPGETTNLRESPVITPEHLAAWEAEHGAFEPGEVVLFHTAGRTATTAPSPTGSATTARTPRRARTPSSTCTSAESATSGSTPAG